MSKHDDHAVFVPIRFYDALDLGDVTDRQFDLGITAGGVRNSLPRGSEHSCARLGAPCGRSRARSESHTSTAWVRWCRGAEKVVRRL